MAIYFDVREIGPAAEEYVAWVDVMGIRSAFARSTNVAANFVCKLHSAALSASDNDVKLYPVMDGFYVTCADAGRMRAFLGSVYEAIGQQFVGEPKHRFRFVIRGAIARGDVIHGRDFGEDASKVLNDNKRYRKQILLGEPMVLAHIGEREAPPFGLFVDETANSFNTESGEFPFDVWWRWYIGRENDLLQNLRETLEQYYDWCLKNEDEARYDASRIRIHRGQARLYLSDT